MDPQVGQWLVGWLVGWLYWLYWFVGWFGLVGALVSGWFIFFLKGCFAVLHTIYYDSFDGGG
jgi:hypothetical protein